MNKLVSGNGVVVWANLFPKQLYLLDGVNLVRFGAVIRMHNGDDEVNTFFATKHNTYPKM